jgi:ketosteroid isomerase-like protein
MTGANMRTRFRTTVFFALLTLPLLAQETVLKADNNSGTVVEKLVLDLAKLMVAGKWDEYASYLSEDFVRTRANGTIEHKPRAWAEFRTGNNKLLDMIPEELQTVSYGDTAAVIGHVSILGRQNGKVTTTFSRFTDVFVQRDGHWFMIASQATPLSK